jgi:hypothetical protein
MIIGQSGGDGRPSLTMAGRTGRTPGIIRTKRSRSMTDKVGTLMSIRDGIYDAIRMIQEGKMDDGILELEVAAGLARELLINH